MLNEPNAQELAQIAHEVGALVLRGQLRCPGPETGDWEIGSENTPDVLYQLRDPEVLLILAPEDGGDAVHMCGICGLGLRKPGEPCPRCASINEVVGAAMNGWHLSG